VPSAAAGVIPFTGAGAELIERSPEDGEASKRFMGRLVLAHVLWPTLERKIEQVKANPDAPVPPLVEVMSSAYHLAQRVRYYSFVLSEVPDEPTERTAGLRNQ
jgi:hypothetical protein